MDFKVAQDNKTWQCQLLAQENLSHPFLFHITLEFLKQMDK